MSIDSSKAYSEVNKILDLLSVDMVSKIPIEIREVFNAKRDVQYNPDIKKEIPLEEQNLLDETISILAFLKFDYWSTDDEKKKLKEIFYKNEQVYQEKLKEIYSVEEIFKKRKNDKQQENTAVVVYKKENIFQKIINLIRQIGNNRIFK